MMDKMKSEKQYYKLADYFITIGLDDYYQKEEIYRMEDKKSEISEVSTELASNNLDLPRASSMKLDGKNICDDFKIIEEDGLKWDRIIKSLEIFVIEDP